MDTTFQTLCTRLVIRRALFKATLIRVRQGCIFCTGFPCQKEGGGKICWREWNEKIKSRYRKHFPPPLGEKTEKFVGEVTKVNEIYPLSLHREKLWGKKLNLVQNMHPWNQTTDPLIAFSFFFLCDKLGIYLKLLDSWRLYSTL